MYFERDIYYYINDFNDLYRKILHILFLIARHNLYLQLNR